MCIRDRLQLARQNPVPGEWEPLVPEDVNEIQPPNFSGFRLITDTRVLDARAWQPDSEDNRIVSYRRMLVRRVPDSLDSEDPPSLDVNRFRIQQFNPTGEVSARSSNKGLAPVLRRAPEVGPSGEKGFTYEAEFDLSSVPSGEDFDVGFELVTPGVQGREDRIARLTFPIIAPTDVATMWVLLPPGRPYRDVDLIGYDRNAPAAVNSVEPTYRFDMADGSLFGWMLVAPRDNFIYECRWTWRYE